MSIDARLEALTTNLELEARKTEDLRVEVGKLTAHMSTLATAMTELARVTRDHEQRLNHFEGQ